MKELNAILNQMLYYVFYKPGFSESIKSMDIKWLYWPTCRARTLMIKYDAINSSKGHEAAKFELLDEANQLFDNEERCTDLPTNDTAICHIYNKELTRYMAKELSLKLSSDPDNADRHISEFKSKSIGGVELYSLDDVLTTGINDIRQRVESREACRIIDNFEQLSKTIGGFDASRTSMILGSTGFGKTNLAMNLALNAKNTMQVVYINMEMDLNDIAKRIIVNQHTTTFEEIYLGNIPSMSEINIINTNNLYFSSGRALSVDFIKSLLRRKKNESGLDLVFIDYDQKLVFTSSSEDAEWKQMQDAMLELEELAKELKIHICTLAQINRDGKIASSFRSLQNQHTVLKFYEHQDLGAIIEIEKNRHGPRGMAVKVNYDTKKAQVRELELIQMPKEKEKDKKWK